MAMIPHPSGIANAYASTRAGDSSLVFAEEQFVHGVDMNAVQDVAAARLTRVGNLVAADGDRRAGGEIVVDTEAGTVTMGAGRIYIGGDVLDVPSRTITGVSMTGTVRIGVRRVTSYVTADDDVSLVGPMPGSEGEGEPTAAREVQTLSWATQTESRPGDFFGVYTLQDGTPLDQSPPPTLSGVRTMLADYDRPHGSYIVSGCAVSALGRTGADQVFSIGAGEANISGYKNVRAYALRHAEEEVPDLETITAEPHTYTAATGAANTVAVNRAPISSVQSVVVVKRITESIVRGGVSGGTDDLTKSSVVAIEAVVQGGTTFAGTTYALAGDAISWAPAGAEPAGGSTYSVTYLYNEAQAVDSVTDTTVVVSGGVNGRPVLVSYKSKLPRVDLMCLTPSGAPYYVKGVSARSGAMAPICPTNLLKLAEITNTWMGAASVNNNGTFIWTYDRIAKYMGFLVKIGEQFNRANAERDILSREPVAKAGIFTDAFQDDQYRDQGEAQTAAIFDGTLGLAVDTVGVYLLGTSPAHLNYTTEVVVEQPLATSSSKINPYASIERMPAGMTLEPPVDFWTDFVTTWTSPESQEFTTVTDSVPAGTVTSTTTINEVVGETVTAARTLRQIDVIVHLAGFGVGENLESLEFGGVDVTPSGTVTADSAGEIDVTVTIPAGIPAGTVLVRADGAAGSFAEAIFVGQGTIEVTTMRAVTLIQRAVRATVTNVTTITNTTGGGLINGGGNSDPLAETVQLPAARQVTSVLVKIAAIGDRSKGLRIQIVRTDSGYPTMDVIAEAFVSMATPAVGDWIEAAFALPVYLDEAHEYAFSVLTDDTTHAIAIARLGDVATAGDGSQAFVSSQPYTVGVMFSSANRSTWTAHQDADLTFRIKAARYSTLTKTVTLGTVPLVDVSDLLIRATVELPTAGCGLFFQVVRADGSVIPVAPGQSIQFDDFVTETVTIKAALTGTEVSSPILYPGTTVIAGRLRTTGTYVTRAFTMGTGVDIRAVFVGSVPAGATVAVDVDDTSDTWAALSVTSTEVLGGGWNEPEYRKDPYTAALGRIRLTLGGTPAARPKLARLRAFAI